MPVDIQQAVNPTLWADTGGITGLVIFALFLALGIFLWAQLKIYEMHRSDLKQVMDMHAAERTQWGSIIDIRQQETNKAIMAMTAAIMELNNRSYRYTDRRDGSDARM